MFISLGEGNYPGPLVNFLIHSKMRIFLSILTILPLLSRADSVETSDGSIIRGELMGMLDGNLTIQTAFAGKIKIPYTRIAS